MIIKIIRTLFWAVGAALMAIVAYRAFVGDPISTIAAGLAFSNMVLQAIKLALDPWIEDE